MPGRVLIVDPLPTNRIVMRAKMNAAYFDTELAASGAEALAQLSNPGAALVLITADLPDTTALALCQRIRALRTAGTLPVVMIGRNWDTARRMDALQAGADAVLDHPVSDTLLMAQIRCLLRTREGLDELRLREGSSRALGLAEPPQSFQHPARVAVIPDDVPAAARLAKTLDARLPHAVAVAEGAALVRGGDAAYPAPDLAVVLLNGRGDDTALQLIAGLRAQPETRAMAILALASGDDQAIMAEALERGANDVTRRDIAQPELDLRLARLIRAKQRADRLRDTVHDGLRAAVTDALTGLYNRRYALPQLAQMAQEARNSGQELAVMIADLDHFKSVNDSHGHAVGDAVLQQVAHRLRTALRPGDMLARIGGEEFLIAAPGHDRRSAKGTAEALRKAVAQAPLHVADCAHPLRQTISVGLAMSGETSPARAPAALLAQADRALYDAKTGGRNAVTLAKQTAA